MKTTQLAINSVSVSGDLETKLEAFGAAGFRHVEFALGDAKEFLRAGHSVDDVKTLLAQHHLRCIGGFEGGLDSFSDDAARAQNHAQVRENAELLSQFGARTLVVGTDAPPPGLAAEEILDGYARGFADVARQIENTGVTVCIEFNWGAVKSLRAAAEIARRANALTNLSNIGVLFDPAHYHCTPTKFDQLTSENIAQIKHVHVDDMNDKPGEFSDCNADRALPGSGHLDLRALFGAIESGGYDGFFSIEMFSDELWQLPARQSAQKMYQSLLPLCKD